MHMPSITADCLAVLALTCAALTPRVIQLRQSGQPIFNGGILLFAGFLIACTLPILSRLPWAEIAEEASEQATAAIQLLQAAYIILTL
ncbi:hypothetical protein [Bradyrhizobium cajani]|uniref:Uncharacterized protein n=1 Tax=Bradyrhizobium cajani TaxID=1928661 RepID=A0A844TGX7_9BRAD|nr:hypothetical protein [Bradyrhizobium cajani]MCP3372543.1 hypothetical protein [Bradyrhizobium cajani]MVT76815.1 hypothetical protein [Bradyrhizobium cajani]